MHIKLFKYLCEWLTYSRIPIDCLLFHSLVCTHSSITLTLNRNGNGHIALPSSLDNLLFSRMHATLYAALLVRWSVGCTGWLVGWSVRWLVGQSISPYCFCKNCKIYWKIIVLCMSMHVYCMSIHSLTCPPIILSVCPLFYPSVCPYIYQQPNCKN